MTWLMAERLRRKLLAIEGITARPCCTKCGEEVEPHDMDGVGVCGRCNRRLGFKLHVGKVPGRQANREAP